MSHWALSELERRLANIIRVGVIANLDEGIGRVRVKAGDMVTGWLPWLTYRAGPDRTWWAPEPGEQVLLLAPSGELAQAFVLPAIYQKAYPAPSNSKTIHRTEYEDGTVVEYDRTAHELTVDCVGNVTVRSPSQVKIDSPETLVTGTLTVEGLLTYLAGMAGTGGTGATAQIDGTIQVVNGDVTADGISLKGHIHTGDSGGSTSTPQ